MPAAELCRFTVTTPSTYADVAVPESVRVCELVPKLVEHCGDRDLAGHPIILQRLGEEPFEPEQTVRGAAIRDGETLLLRVRDDAVPPMLFDDLVDGVGRAVADGFGRWSRGLLGHWFALYGTVPLALGLVLFLTEPASTGVVVGAGLVASLLLAATVVLARAFGDRQLTLIFGSLAPLYAGAAAWALGAMLFRDPAVLGDPAALGDSVPFSDAVAQGLNRLLPVPGQAAMAAGTVAGVALIVGRVIGRLWPPNGVVAAVSLVATAAALAATFWSVEVPLLGATVAVVLVLAGPTLPTVAYRFARLAPPDLAQEPADLHSEIVTPLVGNEVLARGRLADSYLTVLNLTTGLAAAGALVAASFGSSLIRVLVAVTATGLLLRSRLLRNLVQRLALVAAGMTAWMALGVQLVYRYDGDARLVVGAVVAVLATSAAMVVCRLVFPLRLSPVWGRAADLAETAVGVASLPLLLWAHGLFSFARGLAG